MKVCKECGAILKDAETEVTSIEEAEPVEVIEGKGDKQSGNGKIKKLSGSSIFLIWILLIVAGGVMLYGSGTFDEVPPADISSLQGGDFDQMHKGAEMENLQQINNLRETVESEPENYAALLDLAHLLGDNGFFDKAVERYNTYLTANPEEADVWVDLGVCYFEMNDYGNAAQAMNKALALNPQHTIAHFNMGIIKFSDGDKEAAKEWWRKVIELEPESNIAQKAKELIESN